MGFGSRDNNKMPKEKKTKTTMMEVVTREYTINLHKRLHTIGFKYRAPRAIKEIKKFAECAFGWRVSATRTRTAPTSCTPWSHTSASPPLRDFRRKMFPTTNRLIKADHIHATPFFRNHHFLKICCSLVEEAMSRIRQKHSSPENTHKKTRDW